MKIMKRMMAGVLLAAVMAGCSGGGGSSSQQVEQLADQTQALATQLQIAASVDAVRSQQVTLTILGDTLSRLQSQVETLPAAEDLEMQITAVATLVSSVQTQLAAELEALKAGTTTTFKSYTTAIGAVTIQVKNIAADIAASGTTSSLPAVHQVEASQLATAQVLLTALQAAVNGLPTTITDAINPQITNLEDVVAPLQQQVIASGTMTVDQQTALSGQVSAVVDQVAALAGTTVAAAGDLANITIIQQAQVATIQTLAASATILASQDIPAVVPADSALQSQLDAATATIGTQTGTIADLNNQLGTATSTIGTQTGTIADLNNQLGTATSTIGTQAGTIADLQAEVGSAAATIITANQTISQLEAAVDSLEAAVTALQDPQAIAPVEFTVSDDGTTAKTVAAKIAAGAAPTLYFTLTTADNSPVTATLSAASGAVDADGVASVTVTENGAGKNYILTASTTAPTTTVGKVADFLVPEAVAAGSLVYRGSVTISTLSVGWQQTVAPVSGGTVAAKAVVATAAGSFSAVSESVGPVVASTEYSHLEKRDPNTGAVAWSTAPSNSTIYSSVYTNSAGDLFAVGLSGVMPAPIIPFVSKINTATGATVWTWTTNGAIDDVVFDSANNLFIAYSGGIAAVTPAGGVIWNIAVGNGSNHLAIKDATLYQVNSFFGSVTLTARSVVNGAQLWTKTAFAGDISTTSYSCRSVVVTDALYVAKHAQPLSGSASVTIEKIALDGTNVGSTYAFAAGVFEARLMKAGTSFFASYQINPVSFGVVKLNSTNYDWTATYPTPIGMSLQVGIVGTQLYSGGGTSITRFNDLPAY